MPDTTGTYGDAAEIRRMSDNPTDEQYTPTSLGKLIKGSDIEIGNRLNKRDWTEVDNPDQFQMIRDISNLKTAAKLIRLVKTDKEWIDRSFRYDSEANEKLEDMTRAVISPDHPALFVVKSNYLTRGLNDSTENAGNVDDYLSDY